jgi:hypothetical protein
MVNNDIFNVNYFDMTRETLKEGEALARRISESEKVLEHLTKVLEESSDPVTELTRLLHAANNLMMGFDRKAIARDLLTYLRDQLSEKIDQDQAKFEAL